MTEDMITAINKALETLKEPKSMSMYTTQNDMISDLMKERRLSVEAIESLQRENEALKNLIDGDGCTDPDKIDALFRRAEAAEAEVARLQAEPVAELRRINEMMDEGDNDGSPILPEFEEGLSVEAKVEKCLHLLEKRRDVIDGFTAKEIWRDDPAQDERWNAGLDFAMLQLCKVLKVDPQSINWDCATETLEGDAQSQIHKVIDAALSSTGDTHGN